MVRTFEEVNFRCFLTKMFLHLFALLLLCSTTVHSRVFNADYKKALKYSVLYFEAQRSGKLPENYRILWRGDSALDDKGMDGEDLSGGYYDGSDFVKFSYTIAYATTLLSWGVYLYPDVYKSIGEYEAVLEAIKWSTDYFKKCHISSNELYGQVGDFKTDHQYWGRPEEMNMSRPAYKINETHPGSDLASEVSAVFSSASIIFKHINYTYSEELLKHSEELYEFAKNFRGLSKDVIPGAKQYYHEIHSYGDQLVWAAIWLYKATNNFKYLRDAERFYEEFDLTDRNPSYFFFNEKLVGIRLLLGNITNDKHYQGSVKDFCDYAVDRAPRTPHGLIFVRKFGTLALAANVAFICLEAAKINEAPKDKYIDFAKSQLDYMLGSTGQSYVVGYGDNFPKRPYHLASSCPDVPKPCGWHQYNSTDPNPQILYGALVSGPNATDYYIDQREDTYFEYNVVSLDFNAGFQNALAALVYVGFKQEEQRPRDDSLLVIPLQNSSIVN